MLYRVYLLRKIFVKNRTQIIDACKLLLENLSLQANLCYFKKVRLGKFNLGF